MNNIIPFVPESRQQQAKRVGIEYGISEFDTHVSEGMFGTKKAFLKSKLINEDMFPTKPKKQKTARDGTQLKPSAPSNDGIYEKNPESGSAVAARILACILSSFEGAEGFNWEPPRDKKVIPFPSQAGDKEVRP